MLENEQNINSLNESIGSVSVQDQSIESVQDHSMGSISMESLSLNTSVEESVEDDSIGSNVSVVIYSLPNPNSAPVNDLSQSSSQVSRTGVGNNISGISCSQTTGTEVSDNPQLVLEMLVEQKAAILSDQDLDASERQKSLLAVEEEILEATNRCNLDKNIADIEKDILDLTNQIPKSYQKPPFASISISSTQFVHMAPNPNKIVYDVSSNSGISVVIGLGVLAGWYYLIKKN